MTDSPNLALAEKIEQQIFLRYGPWCDIGLERKEWEQVIAALRAQPSGDWVMVPRKPTPEMIEALEGHYRKWQKIIPEISDDDVKADSWGALQAYRAMLSAAKERG